MKSSWTDTVMAIGTIIAAIAAIIAAVAAVRIPWSINETTADTQTLQLMNELNREIAGIISEKMSLDEKNCKPDNSRDRNRFSYSYISNHSKVEGLVFRLLNEYDYVCLGGNAELFNDEIINQIRGNALSKTWKQYGKYIDEYREKKDSEAWIECDKWLRSVRSNDAYIDEYGEKEDCEERVW